MKKEYLKLHFLVLIFGFTGILGKLIEAGSLVLVIYRTLIAAVGLWILIYLRKKEIKLLNRDLGILVFVGMILGLHWFTFFASGKLSTVSISLVAFSTTSFFTVIVESIFLKKKIKIDDLALGLIAILGVLIIFGFEIRYWKGTLVGLISAFLASGFSVINSKITHRYDNQVISFIELGSASISLIIILLFVSPLSDLVVSQKDLFWILILSLVCTVYPHSQMIGLLRKIPVFETNLALNLEPVYGIILAYLVFGESEKMSNTFYLGAVLVLVSVFFRPLFLKGRDIYRSRYS
jgi:drug/metabolite transporter (DMT)-like permease